MVKRILFVTGRLAEPALRGVLADMHPDFAYDVAVMGITVAALMTTEWIARGLAVDEGTDLVVIPGLCEGDPAAVAEKVGVSVEKGPKDLREIPARMSADAVRQTADYFRASGADVIDVGCTPGVSFPGLGDVVRGLVAAGMRVSVDTFDADEIRTAVAAGAELVLSVNGSNLEVAKDLVGTGARVVVVPDLGGGLETLEPSVTALERWSVGYLIDPILEPIGFGFVASLERYAEVRRRYPDAAMLMGIGNLTELTAADSTGVNAMLVAVCQELGVRAVLTTEVIPWARGAVREVDVARRLMHYAVTQHTIPKGVDNRLVTLKDPAVLTFREDELRALQAQITDPNYRIFADRDGITVLNNERFVRWTDPGRLVDLFMRLDVTDAAHAFYLGRELARASLAVTLGKTYRQEGALSWGYLTPPDEAVSDHVTLTQRSKRKPSA